MMVKLFGVDGRFFRYLWPYKAQLALALLVMLGIAAVSVAMPWPLKYLVDNVIGKEPFDDQVGRMVGGIVGDDRRLLSMVFGLSLILLTALNGLLSFCYEYLKGMIQTRTTFRLQSALFARLHTLSLHFHDQRRTGEVIARVHGDVERVTGALVGSTGAFLVSALQFLGIVGVMLFVNWHFSVIALAYAPLLLGLFNAFRRNLKENATAIRAEEGRMVTVTEEAVGGMRIVQAYGREGDEQRRFEQHGASRVQAELRATRSQAAFEPIVDLVKACGVAAVIWYGIAQIFAARLSLGELVVFLLYLTTFYSPLKGLSALAGAVQEAAISSSRLTELLDSEQMIPETAGAIRFGRAAGRITCEQVSFTYDGKHPVLHDVNFNVLGGQRVGLVGSTGAGKTTLINLLLRFYDVTDGRILLDSVDIRRIRLRDLRRQWALVPQEPILFATSVRDNIAYGRPDAKLDEIVTAAQAANAHAFIVELPEGYDTVIGAGGVKLSGGQRQRIGIARALLFDAPILVLDEPSAALDAQAEREVMEALDRLMQGRTTFVIAHRLSTIRNADLILVMEEGHIVEQGEHTTLMARNRRYAELVKLQQPGVWETAVAVGG